MQIFETWQHKRLAHTISLSQNKMHCSPKHNNMSANGTPPAFQFDTFPTALENANPNKISGYV
jgi:hypothetical protein